MSTGKLPNVPIPLPTAVIDNVLQALNQAPGSITVTAKPGRHLQGKEFVRRARELEARDHAERARAALWHPGATWL